MSEQYKLYGDEILLTVDHSKTRHRYYVQKKLPDGSLSEQEITEGATGYLEVIPKFLLPWAASTGSQYWVDLLKQSGVVMQFSDAQLQEHHELARKSYVRHSQKGKDKGTDYHTAMEFYNKNGKLPLADVTLEVAELCNRTIQWQEESGWKFTGSELGCYSKLFGYAGKIDLEGISNTQKNVICDYKSTKLSRSAPDGVYLEMFIQMGGYAQCRIEEGQRVDDLCVLNPNHIDDNGNMIPSFASSFGMAVEDAIHLFTLCKTLTDTVKYWEAKRAKE